MTLSKFNWAAALLLSLNFTFFQLNAAHSSSVHSADDQLRFVQVEAHTREDRSAIANLGVSIEAVRSDSVWVIGHSKDVKKLAQAGHKILGNFDISVSRGGHNNFFGFPPEDARFHSYDKLQKELADLQSQNPNLVSVQSIGKSVENRDLLAIHINTSSEELKSGQSNKPGIIFMGNHHAREHVSLEIPLMLAQYLVSHQNDAFLSSLLKTRDIWIIPSVNPDGAEFDVSTGRYKWWRKNRRNNQDGTYGVDLNRNYGFKWGTGGSDSETSSEVYKGVSPFSEPETQAVRDFVKSHANTKILLSFHTFSELILYPWGHSYDAIGNAKDLAAFEKMAKTMAKWNNYTPEQASELYIASGDTTDWAYGELGIFAFTFELSPNSVLGGGFYPGAKVLDKVFQSNLQPCLYLINMAADPYQSLENQPSGLMRNYIEPRDTSSPWSFYF